MFVVVFFILITFMHSECSPCNLDTICSQKCEKINNTFACTCDTKYYKASGNRCIRIDNSIEPYILYSNWNYLKSVGVNAENHRSVAKGFKNLNRIDVDSAEKKIYYNDQWLDEDVDRFPYPDNKSDAVFGYHVSEPLLRDISAFFRFNFAVDWVGRKLYYLHSGNRGIRVAELNGDSQKTLIDYETIGPESIAVFPQKGFVFFSDTGEEPFIGRLGMDGSDFKRILDSSKVVSPVALTIDYFADRFYWGDDKLQAIQSCDLDGKMCKFIPLKSISVIKAMSIFEDFVYWYDEKVAAVYKANKIDGTNQSLLAKTRNYVYDLEVIHPLRQTQWPNPCGSNNGGCSHLCLISPGGTSFTCQCPDYFALQSDKRTCVSNCSNSFHLCGNKEDKCIPSKYVCDGIMQCKDGSDEPTGCVKPIVRNCSEDELSCTNKNCEPDDKKKCNSTLVCVSKYSICNGVADCDDGSDESVSKCKVLNEKCKAEQFKCKNGKCISKGLLCDLIDNCGDESDEDPTRCRSRPCAQGTVRCPKSYLCIPPHQTCSIICYFNDTDAQATCANKTCDSFSEFQCKSTGSCIDKKNMCNGASDCFDDNSDETDPSCNCKANEFRCTNGQCINKKLACNGIVEDCDDNSDELDCKCKTNEKQCSNGVCIAAKKWCDGRTDCSDASDELTLNCNDAKDCKAFEFSCPPFGGYKGRCVPKSALCNGIDDCGDLSDELPSTCAAMKRKSNATTSSN